MHPHTVAKIFESSGIKRRTGGTHSEYLCRGHATRLQYARNTRPCWNARKHQSAIGCVWFFLSRIQPNFIAYNSLGWNLAIKKGSRIENVQRNMTPLAQRPPLPHEPRLYLQQSIPLLHSPLIRPLQLLWWRYRVSPLEMFPREQKRRQLDGQPWQLTCPQQPAIILHEGYNYEEIENLHASGLCDLDMNRVRISLPHSGDQFRENQLPWIDGGHSCCMQFQ
jgi:hypothetical protein